MLAEKCFPVRETLKSHAAADDNSIVVSTARLVLATMRTVLIVLLLCTPALAHDPEHPELNAWFDSLRSSKGPCCSFADGFAVNDVDWESKDGHYRVRLQAGRTMVWPMRFNGETFIRCFIPGSMG
jgi:hypothetical protein